MSNFYGISQTELNAVILKDARSIATNIEKYQQANQDKYCVLCNTWLRLCYDVCGSKACRVLLNAITRDGLLPTINSCADMASRAIRSDFDYRPLGSPFMALFVEDSRLTLQVLRYPKRFSPSFADKLQAQGLQKFLDINKQCRGVPSIITKDGKVLQRTQYYPKWLIDGVSKYCFEMLRHYPINEDTPLLLGAFSNGATADGCKTIFEKYRAFSFISPNYHGPLYPIGTAQTVRRDDLNYVKAVAVPKSYKDPRIIAEVSTYTQYHMQGIRKAAVQSVASSKFGDLITFDDQTTNQEWARLGSIYGTYCTIDLSAASDSISDHFAKQVLPRDWYQLIDTWNPKYILADGKKVPRWIFLTSGSGDTFCMESIIFLAIALFATEVVTDLYCQEEDWTRIRSGKRRMARKLLSKLIMPPRVYGDDIACDVKVYDTLVDFLKLAGFTVNEEKSFTTGSNYRESCGAEWWCGLDTSTRYFPRKAFDENDPTYLEGLISLQHRLFEFPETDEWLCRHIRRIASRYGVSTVTSSYPGTECDDLWEEYPLYKVINPPFDHSKQDCAPDGIRRESHIALTRKDAGPLDKWLKKNPTISRRPVVPSDIELCEMFRYVDFLRFGASYDEYGISVPRQSIPNDMEIPELRYTTVKR